MGKFRTEESRQKARKSMLQTSFERSRKVREHDKLAQERRALIDLVREGIACGGSTRQFLRWVERAKFIIANEPASAQETRPEHTAAHDCACAKCVAAEAVCSACKAPNTRGALLGSGKCTACEVL